MSALNIDSSASVHSSLLAGGTKQYRKQQKHKLRMPKIINDQVFHRRAKLEAHSIEAHGLDLKMEQVIKSTAKQEDHICTHPPGVSSVWSNHPLTGRLHPSPCHRTPVPLSPLQPQVYNEARSRGSLVEGAWHGFHSVRTASLLRNLWAQLRAEGSLGGKTTHVD